MNTWGVILIAILFFGLFILFSIIVYMKLCELEKDIDAYWQELTIIIEKRYSIISSELKHIMNKKIKNHLEELLKVDEKKSDQDYFNTYVEIESTLKEYLILLEDKNEKDEEWDQLLRGNKERLDQLRYQYNQRVLRMNRMVEMFPFSIIAKIHAFPKYTYFRNDV